jgi:phospholipid transport system substrate-binding protein
MAGLLAGALVFSATAAAASDPAAARVDWLCNSLLEGAKQKGAEARARKLEPVVEAAFNPSVMAQFVIGPPWAKMSPADHAAISTALTRYLAARYAREIDTYTGQRCAVDEAVVVRGPDKLVKSQIVEPGETTSLNYRLREYGGAWKVIDVYFNGVSQMTMQRADFAAVVSEGGAPAVVAKLKALTAKMLS